MAQRERTTTTNDLLSALQDLEETVTDLNDSDFLDRCTLIDKDLYRRVKTGAVALYAQKVTNIAKSGMILEREH